MGEEYTDLDNDIWIFKLMFLTDITDNLNKTI